MNYNLSQCKMLNTKCLNERSDFRYPVSIRSGSTFGNPDRDKFDRKLYRQLMKTTPKIDPVTIKNGVGNWVLFFVGLDGWN